MKWSTTKPKPPKVWLGARRAVVTFALWPTSCRDGKTRWLEKIVSLEISWGHDLFNWGEYACDAFENLEAIREELDRWNATWIPQAERHWKEENKIA